ncbi:quinolinate synthase NadA [bacterium]|nr:quinolinate synthase NadA [bacterium]MBU3955245.1 quinolinate synthase NadA [bacterium]MBU4134611.1 quinolinate synthase NadA [bacterium]
MKNILVKIKELKKKRNAVILVHNYQSPEVQDIADYRGDSLGLSREAAKTEADVIVFCGVHFMAETAAILSPDKKVLLPDKDAGCPMADMIDAEKLGELKKKHPEAAVVCYVNSTAEVKAESDYCCTSANAVEILSRIENNEIIFVPDKYLGSFAAKKAGKKVILCDGYCPVHMKILSEHIAEAKKEHPLAKVLVHPECRTEICNMADEVLSTSGMEKYARENSCGEMIIGTETGLIYRLQKDNPLKKFYPASDGAVCPNMKKTSLEKVLWALEEMKYEIKVKESTAEAARKAIDRMIACG